VSLVSIDYTSFKIKKLRRIIVILPYSLKSVFGSEKKIEKRE
jgi:hypothetical protein